MSFLYTRLNFLRIDPNQHKSNTTEDNCIIFAENPPDDRCDQHFIPVSNPSTEATYLYSYFPGQIELEKSIVHRTQLQRPKADFILMYTKSNKLLKTNTNERIALLFTAETISDTCQTFRSIDIRYPSTNFSAYTAPRNSNNSAMNGQDRLIGNWIDSEDGSKLKFTKNHDLYTTSNDEVLDMYYYQLSDDQKLLLVNGKSIFRIVTLSSDTLVLQPIHSKIRTYIRQN